MTYASSDRYNAAVQNRIAQNRAKGRANRRAVAMANWITPERVALLNTARGMRSDFVQKMVAAFDDWGTLTEGQENALKKVIEQEVERQEARAAQREVDAMVSKHVSAVGTRARFSLTVERVMRFEGQYGTSYIHILRDADQNILVYRGGKQLAEKGAPVYLTASVKAHETRDGVAQTILARPLVHQMQAA